MSDLKYQLKIEKERTTQVQTEQLVALMKAPLMQALVTWLIVEYLQKEFGFGSISGTVLESGAMLRMFDIEKTTNDISKLAESLAPLAALVGKVP